MTDHEIVQSLNRLALAADRQGRNRYDHRACFREANIGPRGDDLLPLVQAWLKGIPQSYVAADGKPRPFPTLGHYADATDATGHDLARCYRRARAIHEGRS
ncbi:MAG: hypothetical protein LC676_10850 [Loktanella sp.]|nr:hypothetical protein [Loktanella sp.]